MGNACSPVCIKTKSSKVTNIESGDDPAIGRGSVCQIKTNTRIFAIYDIGNLLGKGKQKMKLRDVRRSARMHPQSHESSASSQDH